MKITLKQLSDSFAHLGKLAQIDAGAGITAKQAYWISRIAESAESEMKRIEKARIALVKQYGETDKDGNSEVKPDQLEAFTEQINALMDEEIEIPGEPIQFSDLGDVKLSGLDLLRLRWLIVDDEQKAAAATGE